MSRVKTATVQTKMIHHLPQKSFFNFTHFRSSGGNYISQHPSLSEPSRRTAPPAGRQCSRFSSFRRNQQQVRLKMKEIFIFINTLTVFLKKKKVFLASTKICVSYHNLRCFQVPLNSSGTEHLLCLYLFGIVYSIKSL